MKNALALKGLVPEKAGTKGEGPICKSSGPILFCNFPGLQPRYRRISAND